MSLESDFMDALEIIESYTDEELASELRSMRYEPLYMPTIWSEYDGVFLTMHMGYCTHGDTVSESKKQMEDLIKWAT